MRWLRILALLAGFVVLGAMAYLLYRGSVQNSGGVELLSPVVVLLATGLLAFLTYDPAVLGRELRKLLSSRKEVRQTLHRGILAQLALYGLVSGILLSIMQVLASRTMAAEPVDLQMALWPLLYGVFLAIAFWIVGGLDAADNRSAQTSRSKSGEENQTILAFCVLLMTVGVLSMLFMEIYEDSSSNDVVLASEPAPVEPYGDLKLHEDMRYRLDAGDQVGEIETTEPATARAQTLPEQSPAPAKVSIEPGDEPVTLAPIRWELNWSPGDNNVNKVVQESSFGYQPAIQQRLSVQGP